MATSETQSVPSDLFPHVYSFLLRCQLHKTAKVLKRECELVRRLTYVGEDGERGVGSIIDGLNYVVPKSLVHTMLY